MTMTSNGAVGMNVGVLNLGNLAMGLKVQE
jgi:hypothetical protein